MVLDAWSEHLRCTFYSVSERSPVGLPVAHLGNPRASPSWLASPLPPLRLSTK